MFRTARRGTRISIFGGGGTGTKYIRNILEVLTGSYRPVYHQPVKRGWCQHWWYMPKKGATAIENPGHHEQWQSTEYNISAGNQKKHVPCPMSSKLEFASGA